MNPSSFETGRYSGVRSLIVFLSIASQSIEGNYSVVNWEIRGWGTNSPTWYYTKNIYLDLNGSRVYTGYTSSTIQLSYNTYVASGQTTVYHNGDGTKSMSVGIGGTIYNYGTYQTGGGTTTLATIPRTSTPTMSTTNWNIGASSTIYTNRLSGAFTHNIVASFGSWSATLATGVTDNWTWNTANNAASLYSQIPNSNSGTGTLTLHTYNGGTYIGTKSMGFTLNVVNSNPTTGTWDYLDTNATITALTGNAQYLIKGKSNLRIKLTGAAAAQNYATLGTNAYTVSYNGTTLYANGGVTLPANFDVGTVNGNSASISVKDSRTNPSATTLTFPNILNYTVPVVNTPVIVRINPDDTGVNAHLSVSGTYTQFPAGYATTNSIQTLKYRYKLTTSSTWSNWVTLTPTTNAGGNFTYEANLTATFNAEGAYDFEVSATDKLDETIKAGKLNSIKVSLYIDVDNNVVGLCGIPENPEPNKAYYNGAEIGTGSGGITFNDIYPVGSIYMSVTNTSPATLFGGTWVAMTDKFLIGASGTYAAGSTGGSTTHNHTSAAHSHALSDAGYTCINVNSNGYWEYREVGTAAWDINARRNVGAAAASSGTRGYGWALRGNTDNTTPGNTGTSSNLPPYLAVYMWKRTA